MKASFFKRFTAYFIDIVFITIIASIISAGISTEKYDNTYKQYEELTEKYMSQEITMAEYLDSYKPIVYDMQKYSVIVSTITLLLSIAYFVVFQYLNKGQTLGKKILGIRVRENEKDPSLKSMILRTFIVDSIFSSLFGIILLYILNKNTYYFGYSVVSTIETAFTFITALFILYRKDKLGLHDIIAHTEVIDERGK